MHCCVQLSVFARYRAALGGLTATRPTQGLKEVDGLSCHIIQMESMTPALTQRVTAKFTWLCQEL